MTNWFFTTVVGAVFPVASSASLSGSFAFFSVAITIGVTVVYFFLVETANRTSLEIDAAYKAHKPALKRKVWWGTDTFHFIFEKYILHIRHINEG
jgi:hypothetical protein